MPLYLCVCWAGRQINTIEQPNDPMSWPGEGNLFYELLMYKLLWQAASLYIGGSFQSQRKLVNRDNTENSRLNLNFQFF